MSIQFTNNTSAADISRSNFTNTQLNNALSVSKMAMEPVSAASLSGLESIKAELAMRGIDTDTLSAQQLATLGKFGGVIDALGEGKAGSISQLSALARSETGVDLVGRNNLATDDGQKLLGFASEGQTILLDSSLNSDPQLLARVGTEELAEAAFQSVFGRSSKGDFGAGVAARTTGEYAAMTTQEKQALFAENDQVTVNGEHGEAMPVGSTPLMMGGEFYASSDSSTGQNIVEDEVETVIEYDTESVGFTEMLDDTTVDGTSEAETVIEYDTESEGLTEMLDDATVDGTSDGVAEAEATTEITAKTTSEIVPKTTADATVDGAADAAVEGAADAAVEGVVEVAGEAAVEGAVEAVVVEAGEVAFVESVAALSPLITVPVAGEVALLLVAAGIGTYFLVDYLKNQGRNKDNIAKDIDNTIKSGKYTIDGTGSPEHGPHAQKYDIPATKLSDYFNDESDDIVDRTLVMEHGGESHHVSFDFFTEVLGGGEVTPTREMGRNLAEFVLHLRGERSFTGNDQGTSGVMGLVEHLLKPENQEVRDGFREFFEANPGEFNNWMRRAAGSTFGQQDPAHKYVSSLVFEVVGSSVLEQLDGDLKSKPAVQNVINGSLPAAA